MTVQRVSIEEAAEQLGVSVATIRRRMKKGELEVEAESDAPNAKKWILLEPESAQEETTSTESTSAVTVLLEEQVTYLKSIIETRDRELAEMRMLLARAQTAQDEKLSAIEATVHTVAEQTIASPVQEAVEPVQHTTEEVPAGLWARLKKVFSLD